MVVIQGQLQTLNEMLSDARTNRYIAASNKKHYTTKVSLQCRKMRAITSPCRMKFEWHTSSQADRDNIRAGIKFILDGMQQAGKLPNDNPKWVLGFDGDEYVKVPKGQDKVVITITEYPE